MDPIENLTLPTDPIEYDPEILAMFAVYKALSTLENQDAIVRVLTWACNKLYVRAEFELPQKERMVRNLREHGGYRGGDRRKMTDADPDDIEEREVEVENDEEISTPQED